MLIVNRIIWLAVSVMILLYTYFRFGFKKFFAISGKFKKTISAPNPVAEIAIKDVSLYFGRGYTFKVFRSLYKKEISSIFNDHYFRLIFFSGCLFLMLVLYMGFGREYDVSDLPRTAIFVYIYNHTFQILSFLIILFYTGEAIHRERSSGFSKINDSLPPSNWLFWGSKLAALSVIAVILASVLIVMGVFVQLIKGYHQFNFPLYIVAAYAVLLPLYIQMIIFVFTIHVIVKNKFSGHALAIIAWVLILLTRTTGFADYNLFLYSYTPDYVISDFGGIGPSLSGVLFFALYWLLGSLALVVVISIYFSRELTFTISDRNRLALLRFDPTHRFFALLFVTLFVITGAYNFYNVSYKNTYLTHDEKKERSALYEKQLKQYENLPLPGVTSINLKVDLFPEIRRAVTKARIIIVNRTNRPLTKILMDGDDLYEYSVSVDGVSMPFETPLIYNRAKFSVFNPSKDTSLFRLYKFIKPLMTGDSAIMEINSVTYNPGFTNNVSGFTLLKNGTFFSGGLPGMSYNQGEELQDPLDREKYGLPKEVSAPIADSVKITRLSFSEISGLSRIDAVISTSEDQIAVVPGDLINDWIENNRHFYHYSFSEAKTYLPFPVLSATYDRKMDSVVLDNDKKISIEVYYQPEHFINVARFINACKDGLRYYSKTIGPYQFKQLRIIESSIFSYQKCFPNTITFGEHIGWNADFSNPDLFDYSYYMVNTLLGSQWWKYQVAPNQLSSSNIIAEGLPRFMALMILEKKYGKAGMRYILKDEMDRYLWSHRHNIKTEKYLNEADQAYVWEHKTALALYGLNDLIGDEKMNRALSTFKNKFSYIDKPPYAGSRDLYNILKKTIPDSLQYFLTDTWDKVTFYDNRVTGISIKPTLNKDEYSVQVKVSVNKFHSDANGKETADSNMNDYIDIGIFAAPIKNLAGMPAKMNPLYFKKFKLRAGEHTFSIIVKGSPVQVGIDPYAKLIDRDPADNIKGL